MSTSPIILASTSPYRRELLARLRMPFDCVAPDVDERLCTERNPARRARQLAEAKALAVSRQQPGARVLGSDQVAHCAGEILHKPGTARAQREQLACLSDREAHFDTAVSLAIDGRVVASQVVPTVVAFRHLSAEDIAFYVEHEPAVDCAGGFKAEGLGISLMRSLRSDDPTALIGLPLVATAAMLREFAA
ncbi:MAG: Maf family protein [Oceanococcaceae bacterium]